MATVFSLKCDQITDAAFAGFRGKEQISRPYEYEIFFTVPAGVSVRAAVGQRASILGDRGDGQPPVAIHGVIANIRLLHQSGERALYCGLLGPRLWLLRHFWRSYIYTGKSLKEFITETLEDGGLVGGEYRFKIDDAAHAEEEFVTQYRESHLDFIHRWLEREGIYYHFEHDPEGTHEVLVLVEDKSANVPFAGDGRVKYVPLTGGDVTAVQGLNHIESDVSWLPKSVTIADYDYANPAVSLKSDSSVTAQGIGAIRDYGYRAFVEGDLKRLAVIKAQAIGCREATLKASGNVLGPRAGCRFAIDDRPEDLEEEWLAVEIELSGTVAGWTPEMARLTGLATSEVFHMKVFAVPSSVQYRTPQTTAWPRIYGLENGMVSGEADSPYAQLDDDGRYLVRFEFDTSDLPDAKVSTRVRMLQPHGGSTEGFHFPLRKGTEVMIAFLGGDPDRPFIAGVVPNAHKPSVVGQRNNTQNIIRTGSNNQLVMEDEEGKEFIFLHSPNNATGLYMGSPAGAHSTVYTGERNQRTAVFTDPSSVDPANGSVFDGTAISMYPHTDGNGGSYIGGSSWQEVGGAENIFVEGAVSHGYASTYTLRVGAATEETYFATRTTTMKTGRTDTVEAGGMTQTITPFLHQTIHGGGFQHIDAAWRQYVGAEAFDDYGSWKTNVAEGWNQDVRGPWNGRFASGSVTIDATSNLLRMHSGGSVEITAPTEIKLEAAKVDVSSTGIWNSWLQMKNETFLEALSVGVIKGDWTGTVQEFNGMKLETTAISITNAGMKTTTFGAVKEAWGAANWTGMANIKTFAADVWTGAFKKI